MAGRQPAASLGKRIEAVVLAPLLFVVTLGIGWLIWSVFEWRNGRTPSYRLLGLRIVRLADDRPIHVWRSLARAIMCLLLVLPTILVGCVIGLSFVFGASAPDGLLRRPRTAPWDRLTATRVVDERTQPSVNGKLGLVVLEPIDLAGAIRPSRRHPNGHAN
jgi:hypothetical protein